ncbi:outer membrane beta-barrel protein [Flavobacterium humi]|uniref:PorT family protein n=1 Tax=Flavobacterium humi TaxID=2562683 RepID=A0A4Z0L9M2_9FLAO|nr:outer membrane beta-barrel protein [Flavobacterium humi]TGD59165.1 PorT family protein [Flavobacterium humi]
MKKTIIVALFCIFGLSQANAQVSFKPGLRAGLNFSHLSKGGAYYDDEFTNDDRDFNSRTDFYLGFYGALKLTRFYTLQPEINYSRQGARFQFYTDDNRRHTENLEVSYLSLGVINKFTFNEKFNVHVGPTLDFVVDENFDTDSEVDMAFVLGAGYNFTRNFGIEARIKKGIIPVLDYSDGNHTNVVFQTGITYTFDVK